jgi:hypothetical protein
MLYLECQHNRDIPDGWQGSRSVLSPSETQRSLLISEEAFSFSLAQSNKLNSRFHAKTIFPSTKPRKTGPSSIYWNAQYSSIALSLATVIDRLAIIDPALSCTFNFLVVKCVVIRSGTLH